MANRLHQLQTEARENIERLLSENFLGAPRWQKDLIRKYSSELVAHVYTEAVKECLEAMPDVKERPDSEIDIELAQFNYKDETTQAMKSLISTKD